MNASATEVAQPPRKGRSTHGIAKGRDWKRYTSLSTTRSLLLELPIEMLIAGARLGLAVFSLIAIWISPTEPEQLAGVIDRFLLVYACYSALAFAMAFVPGTTWPLAIATHVTDLLSFLVLVSFSEGPVSPFLIFLTFALLSATLRWHWKGAVYTAGTLVVVLGVVLLNQNLSQETIVRLEPNRAIILTVYLLVSGAMLARFGAYQELSRERLRQLASWPTGEVSQAQYPRLSRTLEHACTTARATGALVHWEPEAEPITWVARLDQAGYREAVQAGGEAREHSDPPRQTHAVSADPFRLVARESDLEPQARGALTDYLQESPGDKHIRRVGTAAISHRHGEGRVFLLNPEGPADEVLEVVEILAERVRNELEAHGAHLQQARGAAAAARKIFARNVHDGVLQQLTAVGLKLAALANSPSSPIHAELRAIGNSIAEQQEHLRKLINAEEKDGLFDVRWECDAALARLSAEWNVETSVDVTPSGLQLDGARGRELIYVLNEAVANAVKHGRARRVDIAVTHHKEHLKVVLSNDGEATLVSSRSLRKRVEGAGGKVTLQDTCSGVILQIELPLV